MVSYERKRNEANGEDNTDGTDDNRSWNCGVEGETDDPAVVTLRQRLASNLMATLCLSAGVPMLSMGDERGRTQSGNNNAYCQDSELSWMDWETEPWGGLLELTRAALALRHQHPALRQRHYLEGRPTKAGGAPDLAWMHPSGREMTLDDWHDDDLLTLGMFVSGDPLRAPGPRGETVHDDSFLIWFNAGDEPGHVAHPENSWVQSGHVVLSTDPQHPVGTKVRAGEVVDLIPRACWCCARADRDPAQMDTRTCASRRVRTLAVSERAGSAGVRPGWRPDRARRPTPGAGSSARPGRCSRTNRCCAA